MNTRRSLREFLARYGSALAVALVVLGTAPLGVMSRPLEVGAEAREAAIAKEMADSGTFFTTRLAGGAVYEKPPFFYAAVASSIRVFGGVGVFSIRFPSILFSAATLLASAWIASILFSRRAGAFAAAVLATTYLFAVNAHDCLIDVSLAAFVTLALLGFLLDGRRAGFPRWGPLFGLAAAGALLSKGFVGIALALLSTIPFWWLSRERRGLRDSVGAEAWLIPALALSVWVAGVYGRGGTPAVAEAIWDQQIGRFLGFRAREYSHHRRPFTFYLLALPGMLFPWILTLPAAAVFALRRRGTAHDSTRRALSALFVSLGAVLLFLSIAGTKRTVYFLPAVPVAAVAVAGFLDARLRASKASDWVLRLQFVPVALSAMAVPLVPALADGVVTGPEMALVACVALPCVGLAVAVRGNSARLVIATQEVALVSLLLLESFSLRRMDSDASAREFFAGVGHRVPAGGRIYSYDLNEDVLGRACLALPRRPSAELDDRRLVRALADPGAFLLAETRAISGGRLKVRLAPVLSGSAGRRSVALYRMARPEAARGSDRAPAAAH